MILEFEDHQIVTDERQFIVQKKKIVQPGRFTKPENVGNVNWEDEAYCTSLNSALKFLRKTILLDNDDLTVILKKLEQLESKINEFTRLLEEEK